MISHTSPMPHTIAKAEKLAWTRSAVTPREIILTPSTTKKWGLPRNVFRGNARALVESRAARCRSSDLRAAFPAERRAGGQRRTAVPARHLGGWSGPDRWSAARGRGLPRLLPVRLRHHRLDLVLADDEVNDQPDDPEQED